MASIDEWRELPGRARRAYGDFRLLDHEFEHDSELEAGHGGRKLHGDGIHRLPEWRFGRAGGLNDIYGKAFGSRNGVHLYGGRD